MEFVYPGFLWALSLLIIPIIIHLFYFRRRKTVYFTNVQFLKEIKEETDARRNIKNWLILLLRLLLVSFLVLAFAQPFITKEEDAKIGQNAVSIFIDNSFSMSGLSEDVPLIERAKTRGREIINGHKEDDIFQILSHELNGRQLRFLSKEDAFLAIDEIKIAPEVSLLSKVIKRQEISLSETDIDNKSAYILSDFQKSITDLQIQTDSSVRYSLIPLNSVQENNLSIDSAWFEAPLQIENQPNVLIATIRNLGSEDVENVRLSVLYNGEEKPVGSLSIPAGEKINDTINITPLSSGWQSATLKITDYPIIFDDTYFISFHVPEKINVLLISEQQANPFLEAGLRSIPSFEITISQARNINYSQLSEYQLILIQELSNLSSGLGSEMQSFVENGGNLLLFPNEKIDISSLNAFLTRLNAANIREFQNQERKVASLNKDEFIFRDVFENQRRIVKLPTSSGNFIQNARSTNEEVLVNYRDGNPYLSKFVLGSGNFYFSFAPLDDQYNDLITNGEVLIPMLYKMAISATKNNRISYTIGQDEVVESKIKSFSNDRIYEIRGEKDFIPGQMNVGSSILISMNDQIQESGDYDLMLQEELVSRYSFNFNRKESLMQFYLPSELSDLFGSNFETIDINNIQNLSNYIQESSQGRSLWKLCIIFALLCLLIESIILRFWKA